MDSKQEILDWLYGLTVHGIKLGLTNITELLRRLGNPQDSFRKIHIAGTDGKGSTSAMISSVLRYSGVRTGLYTSPHIIDFNERISVDGKNISNADLSRLTALIRPMVEDMRKDNMQCTFFEVTTALAFQYFKEKDVEYAVIEVGMGGRFDATNIIVPDVSVITPISVEHTEYLGDTLEKIAGEKAGIIKDGVPVVTVNRGVAFEVISKKASETRSEVIRVEEPQEVRTFEDHTNFRYKGEQFTVGVPGEYQAVNASVAIEAVRNLPEKDRFTDHLREGLEMTWWPCRMQKLEGLPIVLDVTHTKAGSRVLADNISKIYGRVTIVFGVLSDKDIEGIVANLSEIAARMIVTTPVSERSADIGVVEKAARKYIGNLTVIPSIDEAFDTAMEIRDDTVVLITGSFIMAEDALKWLRRTSAGY